MTAKLTIGRDQDDRNHARREREKSSDNASKDMRTNATVTNKAAQDEADENMQN